MTTWENNSVKKGVRGWLLFGLTLGCLLYGVGFLYLFSQVDSLWCKMVSGVLGVSAVTLLPVLFGLWRERLRSDGRGNDISLAAWIANGFCTVGAVAVFSLPICCLFAKAGETAIFSYTLFLVLLFHAALWYEVFIAGGKDDGGSSL